LRGCFHFLVLSQPHPPFLSLRGATITCFIPKLILQVGRQIGCRSNTRPRPQLYSGSFAFFSWSAQNLSRQLRYRPIRLLVPRYSWINVHPVFFPPKFPFPIPRPHLRVPEKPNFTPTPRQLDFHFPMCPSLPLPTPSMFGTYSSYLGPWSSTWSLPPPSPLRPTVRLLRTVPKHAREG